MAKITKRSVDALEPQAGRDVFGWDSELRGFGIWVKPSGVKTFLIQYRNAEGRTRRLVLGQYGALAPEVARDLARKKLIAVAEGKDPSAERHAARVGITVSEVCDWYLEEAEAGRILGRNRRPIKAQRSRWTGAGSRPTSSRCWGLAGWPVLPCVISRACKPIS